LDFYRQAGLRVKVGQETEISLDIGGTSVRKIVFAAPRELRKAEFERGIIARRGIEHLHACAHDLGTYAVTPYDPDLDHGSMLAIGRGRHQAREGYNPIGVGNVGRGDATELWTPTATL
jgi:hypothetical protein